MVQVLLTAHHTAAGDLHTGKINLLQLGHVQRELLPAPVVALVPVEELERRKEEIDSLQPELADETRFVVEQEKRRRSQARQPRMRIVA